MIFPAVFAKLKKVSSAFLNFTYEFLNFLFIVSYYGK